MSFETIALLCTNVALVSEIIGNMVYRRKVARIMAMQSSMNHVQLEVNKLLIGVKGEQ